MPFDLSARAGDIWDREILPTLQEFVAIPNVSEVFEPNWAELGHMDKAAQLLHDWVAERPVAGLTVSIERLEGKSPVLVAEIPPANGGPADDTVLLYGHLDKQPEMTGWRDDLGPWKPVIEGDRLYGRGGCDDGYATFAAVTAAQLAQEAGFPHARLVVLIEGSEESGSRDLPAYMETLADRIGTPSLVVCLDSGCLDYDRLWVTTSLRGVLAGQLDVAILSEGVHSGDAGGNVASTFRIARELLSRLEDETSGAIHLAEAQVEIPANRREEAQATAAEMASPVAAKFPFLAGAQPISDDPVEQLLNRAWRPWLEITGAGGLPPVERAGNVLRASTSLYLSLRIPPTADPEAASAAMEKLLTDDPPYGATVSYRADKRSSGWNAPPFADWLSTSLEQASKAAFGAPTRTVGEGGTITFLHMLGQRFPDAQFLVTGLMGPGSNAHGPNEFMHIPTAEHLTEVITAVLQDHARRPS